MRLRIANIDPRFEAVLSLCNTLAAQAPLLAEMRNILTQLALAGIGVPLLTAKHDAARI